MSKADLIFHGGTIITMDDSLPSAEAVAVKEEKIVFVGKKTEALKLAGPGTQVVELQGKETLLPGFIEPHQHATQMILNRCMYINCGAYKYQTYDQIKELIETTVAATDPASGTWCLFLGWDPEMIPTLPRLDFDVVDSYSTKIPICIIGQSFHVGWSNRKAFQVAGIPEDVENPKGGMFVRDKNGKLTGQMLEIPTMLKVMGNLPPPTGNQLAKALDEQWDEYARCGFTTMTDMAYSSSDVDDPIQAKSSRSDCPIRLALYELVRCPGPNVETNNSTCCVASQPGQKKKGEQKIKENDKLWIAGVKIFADGSPHCGTAAVREAFLDTDLTRLLGFPPPPCYGTLNFDDASILETVKYWHDQGYQIATHAHGERAIEQVLKAYEQAVGDSPDGHDHRHRMEHLGLCEEGHMVKAAELNLALSFFVQQLYFYAKAYSESILGPERTNRWTPLSLATKHKICWTIHQDHPAYPLPPEPFANMMTAVTRTRKGAPDVVYGKEYRVPIQEALKAYTINAAWQIHKEKELGSLTVGKKADLVIVSDNPLKVDPFKLVDIKVIDTYINGRCNNLRQKTRNVCQVIK